MVGLGARPCPAQSLNLEPRPTFLEPKAASRLLAHHPAPEYPAMAKVNYIQGMVRLELIVSRDGRVSEVHALQGHPFLAVAALKAARRWSYRSLMTGSGPAAFQTFVDIKFTLRPRKIEQIPRRPEDDLSQQIRPPQVLTRPPDPPSSLFVRLRILVSDSGQVLDSYPVRGEPIYFPAARRRVEGWKFQPARWGAVHVPWYLEVNVPVGGPTSQKAEARPTKG